MGGSNTLVDYFSSVVEVVLVFKNCLSRMSAFVTNNKIGVSVVNFLYQYSGYLQYSVTVADCEACFFGERTCELNHL